MTQESDDLASPEGSAGAATQRRPESAGESGVGSERSELPAPAGELDASDPETLAWVYSQTGSIVRAAEWFPISPAQLRQRLLELGVHDSYDSVGIGVESRESCERVTVRFSKGDYWLMSALVDIGHEATVSSLIRTAVREYLAQLDPVAATPEAQATVDSGRRERGHDPRFSGMPVPPEAVLDAPATWNVRSGATAEAWARAAADRAEEAVSEQTVGSKSAAETTASDDDAGGSE